MPRISEFTPKYAPSPSAFVAGVDVNENGEKINVQIPFSAFGEYKSYHYSVEYEGVTMSMLIKALEAQGYNCYGTKQPMILTLSGALGSRIFMGYITSSAGGNACQFELFDLANCIKYSQLETTASTVPISTALNNAHPAKYTSGGIKYVTVSDADYTNISFADIATAIATEGGSMLGVNFVKIVEGGIDGNYLLNCDVYNGNTVSAYMLDLETLTQYSTNGATGLTNTLKDLIINRTYGSVTEVGGSSGDVVRQIKVSIPSMESCLTEITDAVNAEGLLDTTILIVLSGCFSGSYLANVQWSGGNRYIISMLDTWGSSTHSGNVDASTTTVREFLSTNENGSSGTSGGGIIDVTELPTENINEDAFYRLLTGTFVYNQFSHNSFTCYCVETLPEVGEPATTDMTTITAYYNVEDGMCYGYVDSALSSALGVPAGWYDVSMLLPVAGYAYGGVVTSLEEAILENTFYLLLQYEIYSYKDGWTAFKSIGKSGTGTSAEVFNHPSNVASGVCSHAEGYGTTAGGDFSHAEGYGTTASGIYSHAEGDSTTASGIYSHAEGHGTTASGQSQHVQGEYNIVDPDAANPTLRGKYAHIVGNGTSETDRSNAHTLDWDGNAWYAGDIYTGGTGQDDTNAKKMATEEYVDEKVGSISSGGSGGGGASIIYATEKPSTPQQAIYVITEDEVVKAELYSVGMGGIVPSEMFYCEIVDVLPEGAVGAMDITTEAMYAYYLTTDGIIYGYVDETLSAAANGEIPVGWCPIDMFFNFMGAIYGGQITSTDQATDDEALYVLLTTQPKTRVYVPMQDGTFLELTSGIRTRFDENSGTVSITEV